MQETALTESEENMLVETIAQKEIKMQHVIPQGVRNAKQLIRSNRFQFAGLDKSETGDEYQ